MRKSHIAAAGVAAIVAGGVLAGAPPAGADVGNVDGYIDALISDNIDPFPIWKSVAVGNKVCGLLRAGDGVTPTIDALTFTTGLPRDTVADVVIAAQMKLCSDAPWDGAPNYVRFNLALTVSLKRTGSVSR